jgi:hypothetical protein
MTCAPLTPEQCSSMIMVMTSRRMWTMFQYVSLSASYVAPSTTWNMCSPRLQQQVRNSQLLRKCHNFSFFFAFSFRIRKYFLHDRNISCDKIAFIMQQSGYFFFSLFYSLFALDISSTTVQFTPHTALAFLYRYYKMTIMWDRKRNEMAMSALLGAWWWCTG